MPTARTGGNASGTELDYHYDYDGMVSSYSRYNGPDPTYSYDGMDRMTQWLEADSGAPSVNDSVTCNSDPLSIRTSSGGTLTDVGITTGAAGSEVLTETAALTGLAAGVTTASGVGIALIGVGLIAFGAYELSQEC